MKKAILYINQFFGQIGGEEKAGIEPEIHEGQIGPAMQFEKELNAEVTHTIICGDNYIGTNTDAAVATILGIHIEDRVYKVKGLVEKPPVEEAPSNVAILGRYIITPQIFKILEETKPGKGGEIQILIRQ